ncbi:N-acetylglucosaminyldiphosphoundecaprenol N-acetyl-beta-D-mannosaminyltransferase [Moheibacter sediminis]|uniref:N-acetylglucosaminyldiphosphoundecaprenol N-acetyl-beta-D-mannosaminyltransferase n=1 Tax=Moheibacter sediminis TaxID=1434700 RepID=A0A1W1YCA8_9FLAO|nr:N-acetylglucosaminyldiphosphoundecaprenol N-acetyl-beta-D-mannosaminyltransferase [Moheibacter sediminis]
MICIDISIGSFEEQMNKILENAKHHISSYVCVANVHMLVEAHKNPDFAKIVNESDLAVPDGMPIAKSMDLLHGIKQERVAGLEIIQHLLKESSQKQIKVGFYGGTQEIQDETKKYIESNFPNVFVTNYKPHPFRELSPEEEQNLANEFNASHTQILFVATGCPRQEKWMSMHKGNINACMIGIGGALTVVTGMKKNAPEWMRNNSLEWLFRLILEPKRLFKRYAVTNTTFLWLLSKEVVFRKK